MSKKNPVGGRSLKDFKQIHNPDADVIWLRQRVAELEAAKMAEKKHTGEMMELVHELREAIQFAAPPHFEYTPDVEGPGSPCTHVMHITDWHYGMNVDEDEVDGFGEFSPATAEQRIQKLAQVIIKKTETQRHGFKVPYLQVIGTGDYINGELRPESIATNAFPAPVQAVRCGYALGEMLAMLAPYFEAITADLVTLDNHGRLTKKPQAAQGGQNNWGYVVGEIAAQYCKALPNIQIRLHAKPTALVVVGPERYLAFHGHQIKGWAGKPYYGFDRRVAMEAVKRMGIPETVFTKLLLGHFHHAINADTWMLGGSLSGTDAFDHSCGRHSKPHQTSWMVHPKHGEFDFTRWYL